MQTLTLSDLPTDLAGKFVLLRVDLNVPAKDGEVTDATRIIRVTPTIEELRQRNARILVLSHFGRPKGKEDPEYSMEFLTFSLPQYWGCPVKFAKDCIGEEVDILCEDMKDRQVALLENTRFHAGEEKNDPDFAKALAEHGDYFVMDAFSAAHRAHASTEGITKYLPSYAGFLMGEELSALDKALENPNRPLTAVVGGAKISTKLELLGTLISKVDTLILGGGMANTFLKAKGCEIGKSLCEDDMLDTAREIMDTAESKGCTLVLPKDLVCADEFKENSPNETYALDEVPSNRMILDAGPASIGSYEEILNASKTLVWNGPLGAFELKPFDTATNLLARHAAELSQKGKLVSVAGGGDTVAALEGAKAAEDFTYVSTAGGAFLEWLEGKTLPGVAALENAAKKAA